MNAEILKVEAEAEVCCVCGAAAEELCSPEEHDSIAPPGQPPLRAVLLHLNNTKTVPSGRFCADCIRRALEAYSFSTMLAAKGPPPLSEKIRALRKRLHELTQKIDVFIVVGGGANGAYSEEDIIMVERDALASANQVDEAEVVKARNTKGDQVYQCTVCPLTFQRAAEYVSHAGAHAAGALHSCWTCGAQFAGAGAAARHAAAPACQPCRLAFQSEAEARRHEAACAGCAAAALRRRQPRHYLCGYDGCILRFATRNNLLSHIRKCHANELEPAAAPETAPAPASAVPCDSCDRRFATAAAMKRHARVHKADNSAAAAHAQEGIEWAGEEMEGKVEYLEVETLEEMDEQADL